MADSIDTARPVLVVDDVHIKYKTFGGRRRKKSRMPAWASGFSQGVGAVDMVHAVKGVSFVAHHGESIGLIGHNGSGKSTLLRAIAGALPVTGGAIYTDGIASLLGVSGALINSLSGERNIILGCLALGLKPHEVRKHYEEVVDFADIGEFIQLPMSAYSSGMGARLRFAISTASAPDILMIDEALATGDASFKARSQQRIDEIRSRAGTVLLVSHSMGSIKETCDRVLWLDSGVMRADGDPDEVIDAYLESQAAKVAARVPAKRASATATWGAAPDAEDDPAFTLVQGIDWQGTAPVVNGLQGAVFTSTDLPDGLVLDEDGILRGSPSTVGTTVVTLTASDGMQHANDTVRFEVVAPQRSFVPVPPARIMDTRPRTETCDGRARGTGPLTEAPLALPVLGRGGVPFSGVAAVALNLTATRTKAENHLTVWPAGDERPLSTEVSYHPGQPTAALVIAKLGEDGAIELATGGGRTDVIADVLGWFPIDGDFTPITPVRLMDTRRRGVTDDGVAEREGALITETRDLPVAGRGGVPSEVTAVALKISAAPSTPSEVTVWPAGSDQPTTPTLAAQPPGQRSNLAVVPLGETGAVSLAVASAADAGPGAGCELLVDLVGWFDADAVFVPVPGAQRLLDTRTAGEPLLGEVARHVEITGRAGLPQDPAAVSAVLLNATAANSSITVSHLNLWPSGTQRPATSNLNFAHGEGVANAVIAQVGDDGRISVQNAQGSVDFTLDIVGWIPTDPA